MAAKATKDRPMFEMSVTGVVVRSMVGVLVLLILTAFMWQVVAALYVGVFLVGAVLDVLGRLPRDRRRTAIAVFGWWFVRPAFVVGLVVTTFGEFFGNF